jgi:hypothetical protein
VGVYVTVTGDEQSALLPAGRPEDMPATGTALEATPKLGNTAEAPVPWGRIDAAVELLI